MYKIHIHYIQHLTTLSHTYIKVKNRQLYMRGTGLYTLSLKFKEIKKGIYACLNTSKKIEKEKLK